MPLVPIPVVGELYESRTTAISNQACQNLYPEINKIGRSVAALQTFPPPVKVTQGDTGVECRGMFNWNGTLYKVSGTSLDGFDADGVKTNIGTITGTQRCVFAANQSQMIIVSGGNKYNCDGSTVSLFTDTYIGAANTVAQINNTFIYDNGGSDDDWAVSAAGDGVTGVANGAAESQAGNLIAVHAFRQLLYLFGTDNIEPWFNTGEGTLGFTRAEQGITEVGCGAKYSIANTDNFIYFVGDDHSVYKLVQYQVQSVTTPAIANFLENNTVSDAVGVTLTMQGQNIYMLTLPTANKTLCYSETTQAWFELSTGVNGDRSRINSYAYCYNTHWIGDNESGSLFKLDITKYQDNGTYYKRERITQPINGETLGQAGKILLCKSLHITMTTGVGQITGDVNPHIVFQYSIDDGQSWSSEHWVKLGRLNEIQRIRFDHMITAREIRYRMYVTDNCNVSIHSGALDVELVDY